MQRYGADASVAYQVESQLALGRFYPAVGFPLPGRAEAPAATPGEPAPALSAQCTARIIRRLCLDSPGFAPRTGRNCPRFGNRWAHRTPPGRRRRRGPAFLQSQLTPLARSTGPRKRPVDSRPTSGGMWADAPGPDHQDYFVLQEQLLHLRELRPRNPEGKRSRAGQNSSGSIGEYPAGPHVAYGNAGPAQASRTEFEDSSPGCGRRTSAECRRRQAPAQRIRFGNQVGWLSSGVRRSGSCRNLARGGGSTPSNSCSTAIAVGLVVDHRRNV